MRRTAWLAGVLGAVLGACGGGGGGSGVAEGPAYWGVPFVPTAFGANFVVGLRNADPDGTTVTVQGFRPDGTAYTAPFLVDLDGYDEARLDATAALGGAPAGGFVLVTAPSRRVDAYFRDADADSDEASRAFALPDLAAPPPSWAVSVNATPQTGVVQVSNATAAPLVVTVTPYAAPADPAEDPVAGAPFALPAFAPWETRLYAPDALAGAPGFLGAIRLDAPAPFLAAAAEDLAFDVPAPSPETRIVQAGLAFGFDAAAAGGWYLDFALVVRNDTDDAETVTLVAVDDSEGTALLLAPRGIVVPARASVAVATIDPPFADILGDVFLTVYRRNLRVGLQVPEGVDAAFRQFDPALVSYTQTVRPCPAGHVIDVSDVLPEPVLGTGRRTWASVLNFLERPIEVTVEVLVPEPAGFDATPRPFATITVPARGRRDFSPDGAEWFDRDLVPAAFVGLRVRSRDAFGVTGWREERDLAGRLVSLSPLVPRAHDAP